MRRALLPVLLAATIAGCALAPSTPPAARAPATAERLLASLARMTTMDELALAAEAARAREAAERGSDPFASVEAALALSLAATPDDAQILDLVAPVLAAQPPADPGIRAMAGFLQAIASDRRKLRDSLATAGAKSRHYRQEAQSLRLRAEAQQERADRLQLKLEALTNLEKSLANRPNADDPDRRPR
ncbi:MAG: hypothetical protein OEX21_08300 [Betaproteobacteria bacterium]|nr:hypothetical protein [Betaproteobacteria bacterium]